jgi:hypothetical protein
VGFWDGSTPAMRFGFFGLSGACGSVLVRLVAMYFDSRALAYLSIVTMVASLGVGFWGLLFAKHE